MLEAKDAEMEASIAKVRLEVKDEIDRLNKENDSLKLKIEGKLNDKNNIASQIEKKNQISC